MLLKCEAMTIKKYLDMPHNIFFIYGSEIVLKNNSKDIIYKSLSSRGFVEKIILNKEGLIKSTKLFLRMLADRYLDLK